MSGDCRRVELIAGTARFRRWATGPKLRVIEASYALDAAVSDVSRDHRLAPDRAELAIETIVNGHRWVDEFWGIARRIHQRQDTSARAAACPDRRRNSRERRGMGRNTSFVGFARL